MHVIVFQVSIYGHSLGSVLSYDILCHQENLSSPFPMGSVYMECKQQEPQVDATGQSVFSNNSEMSDNSSRVINDSDSKQLPCAMVEDSFTAATYSVVHDVNTEVLCHTVSSIATPDVQGGFAEDYTSVNPEGRSQPPLDEELNNSTSLLEEDNKTFGQKFTTTVYSGENGCSTNLEVSAGNYEANACDIFPDEIVEKDKLVAMLEEEVIDLAGL